MSDNNELVRLSEGLATAVAQVTTALVRVDDGSMLTATGLIWDSEGVIVSASHAVERDDEVSVVLYDGSRYPANLVGRDTDTDIAVLKVEGVSGLSPIARQDDANAVQVGNIAVAVAVPGEAGVVATLGLVSRKQETQTDNYPEYILNTDAVFYPGFSGGALIDVQGRMVGMLNRLFGRGMGVALGTPMVDRVVSTLFQYGKMPRGYLGVRTQLVELPENLRVGLAIAQEHGLLVLHTEPGSAADSAGMLIGDILLQLGEEPLEDVSVLRRNLRAGQVVSVTLLRGGQMQTVSVTVGVAKE
jgi:S1-C subfamily serine protease